MKYGLYRYYKDSLSRAILEFYTKRSFSAGTKRKRKAVSVLLLIPTVHIPPVSSHSLHSQTVRVSPSLPFHSLAAAIMAKTRGGFTFQTGRQPEKRQPPRPEPEPSENRRLTRNRTKIATDLGASSSTMKRKSSKGKNPISVSPSDSPPVLPNVHGTALTFRSPKFASRFQTNMANKPIVFGKQIDPSLFQTIGVTALFEKVELSAMLFPSTSAYPVLIKQFYGNMSVTANRILSFVQNKTIVIDSGLLGFLFGIPCSGPSPFTLKGPLVFDNLSILDQLRIVKDCPTTELVSLPTVLETTPVNSVIHKLIRANLIPRTGGRSDMTYQDLIVSALILSGRKFNFALLMINHMESCLKNKTKCFPYGGFLTHIFAHFGLSFENEEVVQLSEIIDETSFVKSKLQFSTDGSLT